jgi:hypothetical protein
MTGKVIFRIAVFAVLLNITLDSASADDKGKPLIFPVPGEVKINAGVFNIEGSVIILLPEKVNPDYEFLSGLLHNELTDRYRRPISVVRGKTLPVNGRFILIGDIKNPLVREYCEKNRLMTVLNELGDEGYILDVKASSIVIAAGRKNGALYGFESLRQIIRDENNNICVPQLQVIDRPVFGFRGIKLYLPGRENIAFFKRFIRDFAALYKFNKIILELNANMRLDRHPELNSGAVELYRSLNFSRLDRPPGKHMEFQNSSHQDNADGGILEKEEVADIVSYIRKFNMEVIPELPSLTHSYYLLAGHEDLAENTEAPVPDTYCPLKPEIYRIYLDVLDEYIDVIHPAMIHIGHDEWRVEKNLCPLCRGKDYGRLYADDVVRIHDYLAKKGIRTALWGDHLLESVTGKDHQEWRSSSGYKYNIPGALTPTQVSELIPKDILVFNWFWNNINNDRQVSDFGFRQVYGNFTPGIKGWEERVNTAGLLGGAPSSWAGTNEKNFGKDLLFDFLGTSNLLWSDHYLKETELAVITDLLSGEIRRNLSGEILPASVGINVKTINISANFNSDLAEETGNLNLSGIKSGIVRSGKIFFDIGPSADKRKFAVVAGRQNYETVPAPVPVALIGSDVNSIIFLHACTRAGHNGKAYSMTWNFEETAELLGWYEVRYEDGFIETIPVRYGVNILDCGWKKRLNAEESTAGKQSGQKYAYEAASVNCSENESDPLTFFAYEWNNCRPGKKITAINLNPVRYNGRNENSIILLAVSISDNLKKSGATGREVQ